MSAPLTPEGDKPQYLMYDIAIAFLNNNLTISEYDQKAVEFLDAYATQHTASKDERIKELEALCNISNQLTEEEALKLQTAANNYHSTNMGIHTERYEQKVFEAFKAGGLWGIQLRAPWSNVAKGAIKATNTLQIQIDEKDARIAELEKVKDTYKADFEAQIQHIMNAKARIAELEKENEENDTRINELEKEKQKGSYILAVVTQGFNRQKLELEQIEQKNRAYEEAKGGNYLAKTIKQLIEKVEQLEKERDLIHKTLCELIEPDSDPTSHDLEAMAVIRQYRAFSMLSALEGTHKLADTLLSSRENKKP